MPVLMMTISSIIHLLRQVVPWMCPQEPAHTTRECHRSTLHRIHTEFLSRHYIVSCSWDCFSGAGKPTLLVETTQAESMMACSLCLKRLWKQQKSYGTLSLTLYAEVMSS